MGSKRYLSPREILGDRRRDRHLTAAEILSDELDDGKDHTATARDESTDRRATPGADWQWLDDERVESRDD